MGWFKRLKEGISTSTREKKDVPDGLWYKCPKCNHTATTKDFKAAMHVCSNCGHHERIDSAEYFSMLFPEGHTPLHEEVVSKDFLEFTDLKPYSKRLDAVREKSEYTDAISVAKGNLGDTEAVVACMNFSFIGGSMGSVVGERIARAIDTAIEEKLPLLIISKTGGARMMESAFSLMQMAKTSAKLTQLSEAKLPYISLMTDPTTGGVTASYAMLGDLNIAEPNALIGFAGPRVIKETIKKDLPEGFQRSEFLLEKGFLDFIVERAQLRTQLNRAFCLLLKKEISKEATVK